MELEPVLLLHISARKTIWRRLSALENHKARKICDLDLVSKSCNLAIRESRSKQLRTEELSADKLQKYERTNLFLKCSCAFFFVRAP